MLCIYNCNKNISCLQKKKTTTQIMVEGVCEDPKAFFGTFPNFHFKNYNFPFSLRGTSLIQSDSPQLHLKDFLVPNLKKKKEREGGEKGGNAGSEEGGKLAKHGPGRGGVTCLMPGEMGRKR